MVISLYDPEQVAVGPTLLLVQLTEVPVPAQVHAYPLVAVGDTRVKADGVEYSFCAACRIPAKFAAVRGLWAAYCAAAFAALTTAIAEKATCPNSTAPSIIRKSSGTESAVSTIACPSSRFRVTISSPLLHQGHNLEWGRTRAVTGQVQNCGAVVDVVYDQSPDGHTSTMVLHRERGTWGNNESGD